MRWGSIFAVSRMFSLPCSEFQADRVSIMYCCLRAVLANNLPFSATLKLASVLRARRSRLVAPHPTDPRLLTVTLAVRHPSFASTSSSSSDAASASAVGPLSTVKVTLLLSPEYPRAGCFVHLVAQIAGAAPFTVDALLKTQVMCARACV